MLSIISLLFTFGISILFLPMIISFLIKRKIGDKIDDRRIHSVFTPTAGGIGVLIPSLLAMVLFSFFIKETNVFVFIIFIGFIFTIGFFDDLFNMKAMNKLVAIIFPTIAIVILADLRINSLYGLFGVFELPTSISYILTIFVIVFLTNAFNLIDGIDGLLSVISSFIFMVFGTWFFLIGEYTFTLISLTLLGSILGFLVYNWHPARIFMGDSGSLAIGFSISLLSIAFIETNNTIISDSIFRIQSPISFVVSLLIFPIFDTLRVFLVRIINKESPFSPDRKHIHHYLYDLNLGHKKIVFYLLCFNISAFTMILMLNSFSDSILVPAIAIFLFSCSGIMFMFKKIGYKTESTNVLLKYRYKINS